MKSKKLTALISAAAILGASVCAMPLQAGAAAATILDSSTGLFVSADNILAYDEVKAPFSDETGALSMWWSSMQAKYRDGFNLSNGIKVDITDKAAGYSEGSFTATVDLTNWYWKNSDASETYEAKLFFEVEDSQGSKRQIAVGSGIDDDGDNAATISGETTVSFESTDKVYICMTHPSNQHQYKNLVVTAQQASTGDPVSMEITDNSTWTAALAAGGDYKVTESFTATGTTSMSDEATSTTGTVDGQGNAITYTLTTPMLDITETSTTPNWTFSNITFSGEGRFFVLNNTESYVTIKDANFDASSNNYALINRNGHLTLENVVFPARTDDKYDIMCQWGSGVNVLKGATKVRLYREAKYYNVDITGLTKGADVYLGFKESEDYGNVKLQTISSDLVMDCDDTNMTIHIYDKPAAPAELTGTITVTGQYSGDEYVGEATAMTAEFSGVTGTYTTASVATTDAELTAPPAITGQFTHANIVFGIVVPKVYADADKGASLFTAVLK